MQRLLLALPRRLASWIVPAVLALAGLGAGPPTVEEARQALVLADPALAVEIAAADPQVEDPVAIAWDEFGRLHVAEMTDYPVEPPSGRIKRLEDRDGDGRYETAVVFAEKLPFPSGVLPWNGGLLVTAAPDLLFLKDTDGDGQADERRVILTGFAEGNTQLRVNNPTWGLDNRLYLANGRSGGAVRRPDEPPAAAMAIDRHDVRVDPATGQFAPISGFSQFGLPRDDWGNRFPSWNTVPIRHAVIEQEILARNPLLAEGSTVAAILDPADPSRVFPIAPPPRTFNREPVTAFNASCGPTIYRGDRLPSLAGHVFVCEPLTSLVHHRVLEPHGPTFVARRVEAGKEFLASRHPWFRPVNLATGPDGGLYVVDFCRAWVEHPAFVADVKARESVDFREGHELGRIWRIRPAEAGDLAPRSTWPGQADRAALVAVLGHPNGWWRDTAQRLLVERQDRAAVPALEALARDGQTPLARIHALWTLAGLEALKADALLGALADGDPRVRAQALAMATPRAQELAGGVIARATDADPVVRFRAAIALGGLDSPAARQALGRIASRDAGDPWTRTAVLSSVGTAPGAFLESLLASDPAWLRDHASDRLRFLSQLAELAGAGGERNAAVGLAMRITTGDSTTIGGRLALLTGLAAGARRAGEPAAAALPGAEALGPILDQSGGIAADSMSAAPVRSLAVEALARFRPAELARLIPRLFQPDTPDALQDAAARALSASNDPALAAAVLAPWDGYSLTTRSRLRSALARTSVLATALVDAIEQGAIAAAELDPATREAIARLPDKALGDRLAQLPGSGTDASRAEVVARYQAALQLTPSPQRGADLFTRHCQTCHAFRGVGQNVGPDLSSVGGRPRALLVSDLLDPSREVAPDHVGFVLATQDGQVLTGLIVEETPHGVRLRQAGGQEVTVPRAEVAELRPTGQSLMPAGFEQSLAPQDVADLLEYLQAP
jgi:putative membrane-bound dehydrogenase-like protein